MRANSIQISEAQVEDALVANLTYVSQLLGIKQPLILLSKQYPLTQTNQRIDLLFTCNNRIQLVELKVVPYQDAWLNQIVSYRTELQKLQSKGEFLQGEIDSFLLVTGSFTETQQLTCLSQQVHLLSYSPIEVLKQYFTNLHRIVPYLNQKPNDYGVFHLGLINRSLFEISQGVHTEKEIAKRCQLSAQTIHNHLKFASEFGLIKKRGNQTNLTDFGFTFVDARNDKEFSHLLSPDQKLLLKQFITKNPFYSPTVYGIFCILESALILSRTSYPIELEDLQSLFRELSGKSKEWKAKRTVTTATYSYLNFAIDLDILGKCGKQIVITPDGFTYILLLELHKSIKLVEGITKNATFD